MEQEDLRELLDVAPNVRTLERLSLNRQVAARTWRSHLQQLGLPNPRAWLGLAHALHVAFFVQRNRTESLQALSEQLGMLTVANMSQQFRRVFGLAPGQVRDLLGAEPLLHRWFQARARQRAMARPR
jgi:AraC-like DNA-binding protein